MKIPPLDDNPKPSPSSPAARPSVSRRGFLRKARTAALVVLGVTAGKTAFDWFVDDASPQASLPSWLLSRPVAHRGLHDPRAGVPENSLLAFRLAIEAGYPIELDVRLLKDGQIVVFHDDSLQRLTGRPRNIEKCRLADLADLRLLATSERIPTLDEVLELVAGRTPLLIETKNTRTKDRRLEQALAQRLDGYTGPVAVQSFNPYSMEWFAGNRPAITRGHLSGDFRDRPLPWYRRLPLAHLMLTRWSRPHFINYDVRCLPQWAVTNKKRLGLPVLGWTVRSLEEARQAKAWCDNIVFEGFRA